MSETALTRSKLTHFKRDFCDENLKIGEAIKAMLPEDRGGVILDVGAGIGDIAKIAFPERKAVLIDILEFEDPAYEHHMRVHADFLDFQPTLDQPIDVMIMSHVQQYLDDDLDKLAGKIETIDAQFLIIVRNQNSSMMNSIRDWLIAHGVEENGERSIEPIIEKFYHQKSSTEIMGVLKCIDFQQLSQQIIEVIFDSLVDEDTTTNFSHWLAQKLSRPTLNISQNIHCYERISHDRD